jgi:hypothetical protein
MKHGKTIIGDLFRHGRRGEDPAMTYMRLHNLDLQQMADEMYDCYSRLQTFDFPRVKESHRKFAGEMNTPMSKNGKVWTPSEKNIPGTYGFNVIDIPLPDKGNKINVSFEGIGDKEKDGFRYGLIAIDNNGKATYGEMQSSFKGKASIKTNADTKKVVLIVVGCPNDEYKQMGWNTKETREYKYQITIK